MFLILNFLILLYRGSFSLPADRDPYGVAIKYVLPSSGSPGLDCFLNIRAPGKSMEGNWAKYWFPGGRGLKKVRRRHIGRAPLSPCLFKHSWQQGGRYAPSPCARVS